MTCCQLSVNQELRRRDGGSRAGQSSSGVPGSRSGGGGLCLQGREVEGSSAPGLDPD